MDKQKYTPAQITLLKTDTPISELATLPEFKGRTEKALSSKRNELARSIGYDGRPVPLYQFIKS